MLQFLLFYLLYSLICDVMLTPFEYFVTFVTSLLIYRNKYLFCIRCHKNNDFFIPFEKALPVLSCLWVVWVLSSVAARGDLLCPVLDCCSHRFVYLLKLHVSIYLKQHAIWAFCRKWEEVWSQVRPLWSVSNKPISHDVLMQGSARTEKSQKCKYLSLQLLWNRIRISLVEAKVFWVSGFLL